MAPRVDADFAATIQSGERVLQQIPKQLVELGAVAAEPQIRVGVALMDRDVRRHARAQDRDRALDAVAHVERLVSSAVRADESLEPAHELLESIGAGYDHLQEPRR